ncbi:MAG: hypothetical protein J6M66_09130 [Lachnospiraceae bacterium]|nr:hypothetical protein [Lachnospiraceae bacterium]
MARGKHIWKTAYLAVTSAVVAMSFVAATYAWFSSNSIVQTDYVTGRADTDTVELQVSSSGGGSFEAQERAPISQVNSTSAEQLLPVSTADLDSFVFSTGTVDNAAVSFVKVENERYYYHGRVYLRAVAEGHSENAKLRIYLDNAEESGGALFQNRKGYMANAARLGLKFDGGNRHILRVSEESNPDANRAFNTVLNGSKLGDDQVIDSSGDSLRAVGDPSESLAAYTVGAEGLTDNSVKPLFTMNLNQIYEVDIYFYMEGCDPDCSDVTQLDALDFHLSFYGILTEEAE